ncbi:MAG: UPF0175 family protein [Ardenticatenaceae bacterium]
MATIELSIKLPREVLSALREDPDGFAQEMRLVAAVKWYEMGRVLQAEAAEIAGLSRSDFLAALSHFKVIPFQYDDNEIAQEGKVSVGDYETATTLAHIRRVLRPALPDLQARYHIKSLALFGSYVRDEQRVGSDLDVLVEFDQTPGLLTFIQLEEELSEQVGLKVDLVTRAGLKPALREIILSEAIPV